MVPPAGFEPAVSTLKGWEGLYQSNMETPTLAHSVSETAVREAPLSQPFPACHREYGHKMATISAIHGRRQQ